MDDPGADGGAGRFADYGADGCADGDVEDCVVCLWRGQPEGSTITTTPPPGYNHAGPRWGALPTLTTTSTMTTTQPQNGHDD